MDPDAVGTTISSSQHKGRLTAVAAKDGITAIKIKSGRMLLAYGFLRKVFEIFESYKTPIDMITTSEVGVSVTIDNDRHLEEILDDLRKFSTVEVDFDQVIVCVVGDLVAENKGYATLIFDALKEIPIRMISYGGSEHNISLLISAKDKSSALNALSAKLF
jgi:aspartate kinase